MPASDLTIFSLDENATADAAELCFVSSQGAKRRGPVSLRFRERLDSLSPKAAAYRPVARDLPVELSTRVSLWASTDPMDRVLVVRYPEGPLVDSCLKLLHESAALDIRIVVLTTTALLLKHLPEAVRLAFHHLPVYAEDNIQQSVDYSLTLLNSVSSTPNSAAPVQTAVRVHRAPLVSAAGDTTHMVLRSRGTPLRFTAPFVSNGFHLNSKIARESADGVVVSASAKGVAIFGPYLRVLAGRYQAVAQVRGAAEKFNMLSLGRGRTSGTLAFDAYIGSVDKLLQSITVEAVALGTEPLLLELNFEVPGFAESPQLELRLHQQSNRSVTLQSIELIWLE